MISGSHCNTLVSVFGSYRIRLKMVLAGCISSQICTMVYGGEQMCTRTLPSGCTMFKPICRSTVKRGSSQTISSLHRDQLVHASMRGENAETYSGNLPLHRATYSFFTSPFTNSRDSVVASAGLSGRIMSPEVSLSSRFTATWRGRRGSFERRIARRTIHLLESKIVLQDLDETVAEVASSCMHWLRARVRHLQ